MVRVDIPGPPWLPRLAAWMVFVVALAALAVGAYLVSIDGEDAWGVRHVACPYVRDTRIGGVVLLVIGVLTIIGTVVTNLRGSFGDAARNAPSSASLRGPWRERRHCHQALPPIGSTIHWPEMRIACLVTAVLVVAGACSSSTRHASHDGRQLDAKLVDAGVATREPGAPPLVLACRNDYFAGTAPVEIASVKGGFVAASERNDHLYLATIDPKGRIRKARRAGIAEQISVPDQGITPPVVAADGTVHFTLKDPDARLVDVEVDPEGSLLSHSFLTPEGVIYGGHGVRTPSLLVERGNESETWPDATDEHWRDRWREVLDVYVAGSQKRVGSIAPDCLSITSIVATDWGLVAQCSVIAPDAYKDEQTKSTPQFYKRSIIGVVDGKLAWRATLDGDVWWAAVGTDGEDITVVENVYSNNPSDASPAGSGGAPYPIRTVRFDREGRPVGEPILGEGRTSERNEGLGLVWTGNEYAAIESGLITRFDSHGTSLGTWRFEPDCTREYADVQLLWTGSSYALCGWYRTVLDLTEPSQATACKDWESRVPVYPNLVYDPAEAKRSTTIADE